MRKHPSYPSFLRNFGGTLHLIRIGLRLFSQRRHLGFGPSHHVGGNLCALGCSSAVRLAACDPRPLVRRRDHRRRLLLGI
jgi:hypothetical protein